MGRLKRPATWTAIALLVVLGGAGLQQAFAKGEEGEDSLYRHLSVFSEVLTLIRRTYVEETDVEVLIGGSLDGIVDALDSLAIYVPVSGLETFERAREIGIGHSGVSVVKERGIAYVLAVDPGSPGAEVGLRRGDILAAIRGLSTRRMPLWQIRGELAAAPGTRLDLDILRRGQTMEVSLPLAVYESPAVAMDYRDGVPIVRIGSFEAAGVETLRILLPALAAGGQKQLVLDLRGTAGGEPESAYATADLFTQGALGQLKKRQETVETYVGETRPIWSGRLLVLTDRGTQGAAEILAQILTQSADAERVGERTFGHAGRESVRKLSFGARLVLADAFYTGPDGEIIDHGLEPQVSVTEASRGPGDAEISLDELILERALELLRSERTPLQKVARIGP